MGRNAVASSGSSSAATAWDASSTTRSMFTPSGRYRARSVRKYGAIAAASWG